MRIVSLIKKQGSRQAEEIAQGLVPLLTQKGLQVEEDVVHQDSDLVLVLGGDGTLLHVAQDVYSAKALLLGINLGGLGYLTEVTIQEMETVLHKILQGDFKYENRMMLEIEAKGPSKERLAKYHALNEIAILRRPSGKVINIPIWVDGEILTTYRGDGLIISTPTGSTAYNLSAGGPILHPAIQALILTPVCPFALSARPLILASSSRLEVDLDSTKEGGGSYVEIDGRIMDEIGPGATLLVKKAPHGLKLISSPFSGYFKILREKLGWAGHLST